MPTNRMTLAAMLTALLCLIGPLTIPVGPIPLSLLTAGLMLTAQLSRPRRSGPHTATLACGLYLLAGLLGLPVFSGFRGGLGALMGPTGGFLLGYLPLTALGSIVCARTENRFWQAAGFAGGHILLYALGLAWYCWTAGMSPLAALPVCVLPFLPGDAVKIAAVTIIGPRIRKRLRHGR